MCTHGQQRAHRPRGPCWPAGGHHDPSSIRACSRRTWRCRPTWCGRVVSRSWPSVGLQEPLVDSGCPPLPTARMDFGELVLEGPLEPAGEVAEAYASTRPHSNWPAATVDDPTRVASAIPPAAPPGHAPVSTDEGGGLRRRGSGGGVRRNRGAPRDRKSTRLN